MVPSMPGLNEKSASIFESLTDPEELEGFFLRLEELFNKSAVTTDVKKKKYTVIYINIKMEKQWKVLEHYAKGTFEEFKKDILGSYNGALAGNHDAMQEMKQLIMVLKREDVCLNRELVDQFLTPMSDKLYNLMELRLERLNPPAGKTCRDPANPYTLEEVMASGLNVLQGVFSSMDRK
ncbi:hypothetical protein ARMGADRAFT_1039487 [Armillaria gallica]|uniref:Uncharacterized protein n=1 Tax=Armillaria gallica TaxID=47427 RepID=A0A2H3CS04_ARMGA|nr:hypothetical protein ARMGADRAFT_1039487 [Armillaria gallica]